jgi:hypothetical protein
MDGRTSILTLSRLPTLRRGNFNPTLQPMQAIIDGDTYEYEIENGDRVVLADIFLAKWR